MNLNIYYNNNINIRWSIILFKCDSYLTDTNTKVLQIQGVLKIILFLY